jgi:hypothetical protein
MKKINAKIQLIDKGTVEIPAYYTEVVLDTGETMKTIVHRDTRYPKWWTVSEYTTGISITSSISDYRIANTRNGILEYVIKDVNRRLTDNKLTLQRLIEGALSNLKLGYVN